MAVHPEPGADGRSGALLLAGTSDPTSPGDVSPLPFAVERSGALLLVCEGPDLRVVSANAAARTALGPNRVLHRPLREVFCTAASRPWLHRCEDVFATGVPARGPWVSRLDLTGEAPRRDTLLVDVVAWAAPDGARRGIVVVGLDVEEAPPQTARPSGTADPRTAPSAGAVEAGTRSHVAAEPPGGRVPVLPGVKVTATACRPAEPTAAATTDWFVAEVLPGGGVGLAVGDLGGTGGVARGGSGPGPGAVAGMVRAVVVERLVATADPAAAVAAVDGVASRWGLSGTTACVAVLDPEEGAVRHVAAGHPAPLLLTASGAALYLPGADSGPLGEGGPRRCSEHEVSTGDVLLLYTDGVLDRPGRDAMGSAVEVAHVAGDAAAGRALRAGTAPAVEDVGAHTLEALVRTTGLADDATVLSAGLVERLDDAAAEFPSGLRSLPAMRGMTRSWLRDAGAHDDDVVAVLHLLTELVVACLRGTVDARESRRSAIGGTSAGLGLHLTLDDTGTVIVAVRLPLPGGNPLSVLAHEGPDGAAARLVASLAEPGGITPTPAVADAVAPGGTLPWHAAAWPGRARGSVPRQPQRLTSHAWYVVRRRLARPVELLDARSPQRGISRVPDGLGEPALDVHRETVGAGAVVSVTGPLDPGTLPRLEAVLATAPDGASTVWVDLTAATHLSAAAAARLVDAADECRARGSTLVLRAEAGSVAHRVLDLLGVVHVSQPHALD